MCDNRETTVESDKIYLYTEEGERLVYYKTYNFPHKKCAYCDKPSTHFERYGMNNLMFSGYLCDDCTPHFTDEEIRDSYLVPCRGPNKW